MQSAKHLQVLEESKTVSSFQYFFSASYHVYFPTIEEVFVTDPGILYSQELDEELSRRVVNKVFVL